MDDHQELRDRLAGHGIPLGPIDPDQLPGQGPDEDFSDDLEGITHLELVEVVRAIRRKQDQMVTALIGAGTILGIVAHVPTEED